MGRWFGTDPQNQFASPYVAMGNNPVMMVDPDGELAFLAIAAIIGKAVAIGAGVGAASFAASTALTKQAWNWGNFASAVGKGALAGGLTAGIGLGVSAGIHALGVGVQSSNFIGGAIGSFSSNIVGGGMPGSQMEWASAIGNSLMTGAAFESSNPLQLKNKGNDFSLLGKSRDFIDLPPIDYTNAAIGNFPTWWGQTNAFLNPVASAVAFQGFYNGIIDNVSNFFAGDEPEFYWYQHSDGSYYSVYHSKFVSGTGPEMGAGKIGSVRSSYQKMKYLKELGKSGKTAKWMKQWLQKGNVPPGHQVHHIKPLFKGGLDVPRNMKLIDIKMHRAFHRLFGYRPR